MAERKTSAGGGPGPGRDAPRFRVWPPVSIAVPWGIGFIVGRALGEEGGLGAEATLSGWLCIAAFAVWNGWCLALFARAGTGLLPGQSTTGLLTTGPYRLSRNPLYVGLLVLYVGAALVAHSLGALVLVPIAWAGLHWGAVLPEERYLAAELGAPYEAYRGRIRRWL